ncbi:uncharacterized protein Thert_00472 [Thermoanaerobacterium thermosaccharolyticum]|uniref:Uncharacterized protein n=1 Tax=Thermoanaerobacterium thermosaccharolyticum TaxID=1517 RepID=A0A223HWK0_THETR|nr:uncharacterized protein Thert_00472 [Thermoanaerobacterium thermosaccharolyticum]
MCKATNSVSWNCIHIIYTFYTHHFHLTFVSFFRRILSADLPFYI